MMQISNTTAQDLQQAQQPASLLADNTSYSQTVAGKTYTASIQQSAGEYVAQVPQMPGVSAVGASLQMAEQRLSNLISFMA